MAWAWTLLLPSAHRLEASKSGESKLRCGVTSLDAVDLAWIATFGDNLAPSVLVLDTVDAAPPPQALLELNMPSNVLAAPGF